MKVCPQLEPLDSYLKARAQQLWIPGTNLAVDECMTRFTGRSSSTVTLPSKPIPKGYKTWALGDHGYLLNWMFHRKETGPVGLDRQYLRPINGRYRLPPSQAVVVQLARILPPNKHVLWIDNLFTTTDLLLTLREYGIGAAGTCKKSLSTGIARELVEMREKGKKLQLPWGTFKSIVTNDGNIRQLGWQDQAFVLFLTTINVGDKSVMVNRKRPSNTSTSARITQVPFGDCWQKVLPIPDHINGYNHNMNAIDIADQLRSYYTTQRIHRKCWKAPWSYLLDVIATNSYIIYQKTHPRATHADFQKGLVLGLIGNTKTRAIQTRKIAKPVRIGEPHRHQRVKLLQLARCSSCTKAKRTVTNRRERRTALAEISGNTMRKALTPKSIWGCGYCQVAICKKDICWEEHIELVRGEPEIIVID